MALAAAAELGRGPGAGRSDVAWRRPLAFGAEELRCACASQGHHDEAEKWAHAEKEGGRTTCRGDVGKSVAGERLSPDHREDAHRGAHQCNHRPDDSCVLDGGV